MMPFCERLSEQLAVVATLDPTSIATAAVVSDVFSMSMHRRALFILQTGATVNAPGILVNIREAVDALATATTAVILTRAAADVTALDSQFLFEVSGEAMADGYTYLAATIDPGAGATLCSMVVLADVERYHPASDRDLNTVVSIQAAN
jgi:hypothetical protein